MARTKRGSARDGAKARFWQAEVSGWRRSGLSVRAWCAQRRLSEPSFYAWRREFARRDVEAAAQPGRSFVALELAERTTPANAIEHVLELVHPRGHVLRIGSGCDRDTLATVLAVLEQPPC